MDYIIILIMILSVFFLCWSVENIEFPIFRVGLVVIVLVTLFVNHQRKKEYEIWLDQSAGSAGVTNRQVRDCMRDHEQMSRTGCDY